MKKTLLLGGRLLCMAMAFAGVVSLASCKDDDEPKKKEEPAPVVPVDTTPAKVIKPDYFLINEDTLVSGAEIKANTLLSNGANTDSLTIGVELRNDDKINKVSFKLFNTYLNTVDVKGVSNTEDFTYNIKFPAIEGTYTLVVNDSITKTFSVVGDIKLSVGGRAFSNVYPLVYSDKVSTNMDIKFVAGSKSSNPHFEANGTFYSLTEEQYNAYLSGKVSVLKGEVSDFEANYADTTNEDNFLSSKNDSHFLYVIDGKCFLLNIVDFSFENGDSNLTMTVTY